MVARRIADAVALAIRDGSLPTRTAAFAQLVAKAKGKEYQKMHPAKMTFQALRIHVNREFHELKRGMYGGQPFAALVPPACHPRAISCPDCITA